MTLLCFNTQIYMSPYGDTFLLNNTAATFETMTGSTIGIIWYLIIRN